jgi:hypothetical protein
MCGHVRLFSLGDSHRVVAPAGGHGADRRPGCPAQCGEGRGLGGVAVVGELNREQCHTRGSTCAPIQNVQALHASPPREPPTAGGCATVLVVSCCVGGGWGGVCIGTAGELGWRWDGAGLALGWRRVGGRLALGWRVTGASSSHASTP